ncbi:MAG: hypothetical protein KDC92_10165 [Bacteroidetes bacterium]|nr:hypothetical protein [Bacteroidota bacterium]
MKLIEQLSPTFLKWPLQRTMLLAFLAFLILQGSGCMSLATFQDAKVLEEKQVELGAHMGYFDYDGSGGIFSPERAVDMAAYLRAGIGSNMEVTARVSTMFSLNGGLKYQFYENDNGVLAMASGIQTGFLLAQVETNEPAGWLRIPYIISLHPSPYFTWYGSANYSFIGHTSSASERYFHFTSGIKFGNKMGLMIESNFIPNWNRAIPVISNAPFSIIYGHQQFHVGAYFRI